jgi:hypothetical protein
LENVRGIERHAVRRTHDELAGLLLQSPDQELVERVFGRERRAQKEPGKGFPEPAELTPR